MPIQEVADRICNYLIFLGLAPSILCPSRDRCYNQRHLSFFHKWHSLFVEKRVAATLEHISNDAMISVGVFLHLWKLDCNKVKNHLRTLSPDSIDLMITVDDLQAILELGRMWNSSALQIFSLSDCAKRFEQGNRNGFMYLVPWTFQEEIVCNPGLSREKCLMKAVLSLKLLTYYFKLCCSMSFAAGVAKPPSSDGIVAIKFDEDLTWPILLDLTLALV
jgi:hypothetical protein